MNQTTSTISLGSVRSRRTVWSQMKARVAEWRRRARSHHELSSLDSVRLKDISLSQSEASFEANKPFGFLKPPLIDILVSLFGGLHDDNGFTVRWSKTQRRSASSDHLGAQYQGSSGALLTVACASIYAAAVLLVLAVEFLSGRIFTLPS